MIQSIGLRPNDEFVEILFWLDAFKRASAKSVTAVIPYFGYAKGDKKDEPRVSIRARVCAECIELAGADRIVTMDLHSPQVQGFFKKPVDNLLGMPLHCEYIKSLNLENYVIVSPDAGFAKQARAYSKYLNVPTVIGDKTRNDHSENAKILELIGDVKDRDAVIVDDFIISGGTLGILFCIGYSRIELFLALLVFVFFSLHKGFQFGTQLGICYGSYVRRYGCCPVDVQPKGYDSAYGFCGLYFCWIFPGCYAVFSEFLICLI